MIKSATMFLVLVLAIVSCKDPEKSCKDNADCEKGQVCEKTWHQGSGCTSMTQCNDDGSFCYTSQSCDSSGWEYTCAIVSCSNSTACSSTGSACREGICSEVLCQDWTQCESGEACKNNACTASECTSSCPQPRACRQGVCQLVACIDVTQCNSGEQCASGNCVY